MENYKFYKSKVLLLVVIISASIVLFLLFLLKNKILSLNLLLHNIFIISSSLSLFLTTKILSKEAQVRMVEECRYHTVGVWRGSDTYEARQLNSKTGTPRNEPGFRMRHSMYVLALSFPGPVS